MASTTASSSTLQKSESFCAHLLVEVLLGATDENIGNDPDFAEPAHRMLRRLCFDLACLRRNGMRVTWMKRTLFLPILEPELAQRLEERKALDVAHGAADLADHARRVSRSPRTDAVADFGGHVRHHLDGAAQVIAAAFLLDDES